MGCAIAVIKFTLFVFNLVCALGGIAMVLLGASILYKYDEVLGVIKDSHAGLVPIVFIVLGLAIFLIAFFGCCGAMIESECMILTCSVLLFLLLVIQIAVGVVVLINKYEVQRFFERIISQLWRDRENNLKFWDVVQQLFHCCGVYLPSDWGILNAPKSCCAPGVKECFSLINAYSTGCSSQIRNFLGDSSVWFGATALVVAGVELVGFIFACCLSNHIRNHRRRFAFTT